MKNNNLEHLLSGGHPNSLGNTEEVTQLVLEKPDLINELYDCYSSKDAVVRLRTSSCFKRIAKTKPKLLNPFIDKFLYEISELDQASAQWTLAILYDELQVFMDARQKKRAIEVMQRNLEINDDWIVQNQTMAVLGEWAQRDEVLKSWLLPRLIEFQKSKRVSVANRAKKLHTKLSAN